MALLALLGGSRTSTVSRDKAVALLWPESPSKQARSSLSDTLHVLHKALGVDAIRPVGDGLELNPEMVGCDVREFRSALRSGRPEEALTLYQGPFLEGFHFPGAVEFEYWADMERHELRREARRAADELAARTEAAGDLARAAAWVRKALAMEPHDEVAIREIMRLLVSVGDRAAAVEAYEAFARNLRTNLELDPSPETVELARAIREGDAHPCLPTRLRGPEGGTLQSEAGREEPQHDPRERSAPPPDSGRISGEAGGFRLRVLGGFALNGPAGVETPLLTQSRAAAALAVMAVRGDLGCTRHQLSDLLWPEKEEARVRQHLRDTLRTIHDALGPPAVLSVGDILRLDPAVVSTDVQQFAQALGGGRLAEAVAVYRGPLLDGFRLGEAPVFERWVADERVRLSRECQEALKRLAKRAEHEGRWDGAAEWWARAVGLDPYNSRFVMRRMVALARGGDRANAILEGEAHCQRLKSELGIEPYASFLEELQRIYRAEVAPAAFFTPLPMPTVRKLESPPEPDQ